MSERKKTTLPSLFKKVAEGKPITWLTCYDYPTAYLQEQAGIDMILVGDSLGMTMLGYESTLPVTMDDMIRHSQAVRRGAPAQFRRVVRIEGKVVQTGLKVGQRVGASAISGCGRCSFCARGQYTWCSQHKFYGSMHAEKFVVAARACHLLPDDVSGNAAASSRGPASGAAAPPDARAVRSQTHPSLTAKESDVLGALGPYPLHIDELVRTLSLDQAREWIGRAGLAIEEEGAGSGFHHFVARKR